MTGTAQKLLEALAEARSPMAFDALRLRVGLTKGNASSALSVLVRRGLAARPKRGHYRLADAGREFLESGQRVTNGRHDASPRSIRTDTYRSRLWRAARVRRRFTINDLVELAADSARSKSQTNLRSGARRYVRALERAGYLVRMRQDEPNPGNPGASFGRWVLVKDPGPKPPTVSRVGTVYDPNSNEELACGATS